MEEHFKCSGMTKELTGLCTASSMSCFVSSSLLLSLLFHLLFLWAEKALFIRASITTVPVLSCN